MSVLFGKGPLMDRLKWAAKMAFSHGKLLAMFVCSYKTSQCILTKLFQNNSPMVSFFAGMFGS